MGLVLAMSILFMWKFKPARMVFATMLGTMAGAIIVWLTTQNVHLIGIVHLVLWLPLAIYLWRSVLSRRGKDALAEKSTIFNHAFFFWVCLLFATIVISLLFDVRDIYLVMIGAK